MRPFTDKQMELLTTFADQAVIAIENVRLFDEVQARTRELTESLEQQTATAEVLQRHQQFAQPTLQPVFDAIAGEAGSTCSEAQVRSSSRSQTGTRSMQRRSPRPIPPGSKRCDAACPFPLTREYMHSTAILDGRIVDIPNVDECTGRIGGRRPQLRGDRLSGGHDHADDAQATSRSARCQRGAARRLGRFQRQADRAGLKTFAAQAVIAIENTRLLNELRESLQQQTATADVLKVISRSTFDLRWCFRRWSNLLPTFAMRTRPR